MALFHLYLSALNAHTLDIARRVREQTKPNTIRICTAQEILAHADHSYKKLYTHFKDAYTVPQAMGNAHFFEWKLTQTTAFHLEETLKPLVARAHAYGDAFLLIEESSRVSRYREHLSVFVDEYRAEYLPEGFLHLPSFSTWPDLRGFLAQKQCMDAFYLLQDTTRFKKLSRPQIKGASIYQEISTKNLWYKDTLHYDHYEVFDHTGKTHLGEADLDGHLRPNTGDPGRRIS